MIIRYPLVDVVFAALKMATEELPESTDLMDVEDQWWFSVQGITHCSQVESFLCRFGGTFLGHEDYFGSGSKFANTPGGLDCVQCGQANIKNLSTVV